MYDPSGKPLRMNVSLLSGSPFESFFVPGVILFLFLGISSIIIAFYVINDHTFSTRLIFIQGLIILGWIVVQIVMIKHFHYFQFLYLVIGVALVYTGYLGLPKKNIQKPV
jgi:hypothetical protein